MGYIGKKPATQGKDAGPALKLDDISSNFDGTETVFDLTVGSTAVDPHINNIAVYLSGVYQIPGSSFSLSGSQIVFTGAPSSSLAFHGSILGDSRIMTPDNNTIEPAAFTSNTTTAVSGSWQGVVGSGSLGMVSGSAISTASFGRLEVAGTSADLTVVGDVTVTGRITTQQFQTQFVSASITLATGSNIFGDNISDSHQFTGSILQSGSFTTRGNVTGSATSTGSFGRVLIGEMGNSDLTVVSSSVSTRTSDLETDSGSFSTRVTDLNLSLSGSTSLISGSSTSTGSFGSVVAGGTGVNSFTGKVGVGETSPDELVHATSTGNEARVVVESSKGKWAIGSEDGDIFGVLNYGTSTPFKIAGNAATNALVVSGSGVGIGTTAPTNVLEVEFDDDTAVYTPANIADNTASGIVINNTGTSVGRGGMLKFTSKDGDNMTAIVHTQEGNDSASLRFFTETGGTLAQRLIIDHDGTAAFAAQIKASDGTAGAPSYSFTNDTDTGIYWGGTNSMGFVTAGTSRLEIRANGSLASIHASGATSNTAFGEDAGIALASGGNYNTLFGHGAGQLITTADQNVLIGYQAGDAIVDGGHFNIAMGANALGSLTTGDENIAIGDSAGVNMTGTSRCVLVGSGAGLDINHDDAQGTVAVGWQAGANITSGQHNTFIGYEAGKLELTGDNNVAIGYAAFDETSNASSENVYIGVGAGGGNDGAASHNNVGVGRDALGGALNGSQNNVAVGRKAGHAVTEGDNNTFIGAESGGHDVNITTGDYNTFLGTLTDGSGADAQAQIAIGYNVSCTGNSTATLGNSGNTISIALDTSTTTWSAASDERYKENIKESTAGLSFLNDLKPVTFNWKKEKDVPVDMPDYKEGSDNPVKGSEYGKTLHGFIAQEVKTAIDNHSEIKEGFGMWREYDNGVQALAPGDLVPMLVKAVQEVSEQNKVLEKRIEELEN